MNLFTKVCILLFLGTFAYYKLVTTTPEYSLSQIALSLEDKNSALFHAYVDVKKLSKNIVKDTIHATTHNQDQRRNFWSLLDEMKLSAKLYEESPEFEKELEKAIKQYFKHFPERKPSSKKVESLPNLSTMYTLTSMKRSSCKEKQCTLNIVLENTVKKAPVEVSLLFEKQNRAWKLTHILKAVQFL